MFQEKLLQVESALEGHDDVDVALLPKHLPQGGRFRHALGLLETLDFVLSFKWIRRWATFKFSRVLLDFRDFCSTILTANRTLVFRSRQRYTVEFEPCPKTSINLYFFLKVTFSSLLIPKSKFLDFKLVAGFLIEAFSLDSPVSAFSEEGSLFIGGSFVKLNFALIRFFLNGFSKTASATFWETLRPIRRDCPGRGFLEDWAQKPMRSQCNCFEGPLLMVSVRHLLRLLEDSTRGSRQKGFEKFDI